MRLGIIGAGRVALEHAKVAMALGHEVVAAATRSPASPRWSAFREICPGAVNRTSPADVLNDPEVDAVIAALPWDVMPEWFERFLACPKPILIEKPIGLAAEPTMAIVDLATAPTNNKLVGYNRRFYEPVRRLADRIAEGGLKAAEVTISEDIRSHVARYGTAIIPHLLPFASCHSLDLVLHLFGPVDIGPIVPREDRAFGPPFTSLNGLLIGRNGVPITLALNASDPSPAGIRCRFDDHTTWHLSPLEVLSICDGYEIHEATSDTPIRRYVPRVVETVYADLQHKPGFLAQMQAFLSGASGPGATVERSLELLDFIDRLRAAGTQADNEP